MSLYQRNHWQKLLRFVRKMYPVYVSINNDRKDLKKFPTAVTLADSPRYLRRFQKYIRTGDESLLKSYKYDPRGEHTICILHNRHEHHYVLCAILIHEVGHAYMYSNFTPECLSELPTLMIENLAWNLGKSIVPKHFHPPEYIFNQVKEQAISTYK